MMHVGQLFQSGLGVEKDFARAAEWYHQAEKAGHEGARDLFAAIVASSNAS